MTIMIIIKETKISPDETVFCFPGSVGCPLLSPPVAACTVNITPLRRCPRDKLRTSWKMAQIHFNNHLYDCQA